MQPEDMKPALKAWGAATVNRYAYSRADRTTAHALAKVRDHAPGTRENAGRKLVGRDGRSRRLYMAGKIQCGHAIIPMWACDPIRASNDAGRPRDNPEIAVDQGIPDDLLWIERAISKMERQFPLRALIVRTEYTVSASQSVKARMVAEKYGGTLTVWQYRKELEKASAWIAGARRAA